MKEFREGERGETGLESSECDERNSAEGTSASAVKEGGRHLYFKKGTLTLIFSK